MKKSGSLTSRSIAAENLRRRPFRTAALVALSAVLAFTVFSGMLLVKCLSAGLSTVRARLGADLVVLPQGFESSYQAVLLSGEPNFFYMDESVLDSVSSVRGVERATAQVFLTSLSAECCSSKLQLIGFDESTDFIVRPWLSESLGRALGEGELVVGNFVSVEKGKIRLFGEDFPVAAKLSPSGTGLDTSVFANGETMRTLQRLAAERTFTAPSESEVRGKVSAVLVKVADGFDPFNVATSIRLKERDVQVLTGEGVVSNVSKSIGAFGSTFAVFAVLIFISSLATLSVVFSFCVLQRRKEWAVLRALGARRRKIVAILLDESLFAGAFGAAAGIALASLAVFPFSPLIMERFGLPCLKPSAAPALLSALAAFALVSLSGALSTVYPAAKVCGEEAYASFREGE